MHLRQVASFAWISAMHTRHGGGGSGGGLQRVESGGGLGGGGGSNDGGLWGNRRWLLLLRGLLGFGAGSCLYWTVRERRHDRCRQLNGL